MFSRCAIPGGSTRTVDVPRDELLVGDEDDLNVIVMALADSDMDGGERGI